LKLSVVIPTKNRAKDLLKAVASIIAQSRLPDELILVDQSDSDASLLVIQDMVRKAGDATWLNHIYDPSIRGLVDAKRVGASCASGDVVCFLEDDVVLESDYLEQMERAFESHPTMMGCCGVMTNLPELPSNYVRFFHLFHRGIFHDDRVGVHGHRVEGDALIPSRYLSGGTSAFRKTVFETIPFDVANGFFMLEDIDFSVRALRAYGPCFFINTSARLAHYMSPTNRAVLGNKYRRKLREYLVFYKKHGSGIVQLANLLWLLVGLWVEAMRTSLRARDKSPLAGYLMGVWDGVRWKVRSEDGLV
jgi:GT2 family glycosyltransferase